MLDILVDDARIHGSTDARGPPFASIASCASYLQKLDLISKFGHGGARENSGGARAGAGRPPNIVAPSPMPLDVTRWYVVRTVHGQTDRADNEIREAQFDVLTARICRPATRARRTASGSLIRAREERYDPLFVHYIIVAFNLADPRWHLIPNMDSVERIISGGHVTNNGIGIPIPVPDEQIAKLRKILSPVGILFPPGYRSPVDDGDEIPAGTSLRIRMQDEPLDDLAAICEMSDGKRIVMLMHWFNRDNVRTRAAQSVVDPI